ncbi:MAG TPA: transglycosylase SLT domain-containing protein [Acidobacteriaceae bacterium]|nr:transglycosylase SLT domain-containing protein [Acidobacteriaceae bacterium]
MVPPFSPALLPSRGTSFAFVAALLLVLAFPLHTIPAHAQQRPAPAVQPAQTAPQTAPPAAPSPTPQEQAAAMARAQRVQALIGRAENSYRSGVANYNANRLEAARLDFDSAVDAMLSSGMDLKTDPQLADEFDHLLSAINSLELVALKQGNGFSPKVEPAPLDAAVAEVTFPPDPALVGRLSAELKTTQSDLPLAVNDYVAGFIKYFSNSSAGHAHLKRSLERAGKYKDMIARILRENGVPQDLIYQAVAESGFQPQALNRSSGAGGMWQFMPFNGAYGLERNGYFDERFDPEKSTLAYAKYMKYLYAQFGDWYLAMAAYDWGPGNVQRVVSRTGYADFWELYRRNALPAETKNYVPGVLAAVIMAKNPSQYGLTDLVPDAPVLSETVTTEYAISIPLVADLTNSSVPEIVALNPALLRLATPRDIPYDLHLPPGTRKLFSDRLKEIPEDSRATWRFHLVKDGESLETIASALHARPSQIATVNNLQAGDAVQSGDALVIPIQSAGAGHPQRYTPRRGDTLVTVADRFGVSVENLREWNHLSSARIVPGHVLLVAEPVRLAPSTRSRSAHVSPSARARGNVRGSTRAGTRPVAARPAPHASSPSARSASTHDRSSPAHHGSSHHGR